MALSGIVASKINQFLLLVIRTQTFPTYFSKRSMSEKPLTIAYKVWISVNLKQLIVNLKKKILVNFLGCTSLPAGHTKSSQNKTLGIVWLQLLYTRPLLDALLIASKSNLVHHQQEICYAELGVCPMQPFIFDHVTFIQFKICCCVQNFIEIRWFFAEIWRYNNFETSSSITDITKTNQQHSSQLPWQSHVLHRL